MISYRAHRAVLTGTMLALAGAGIVAFLLFMPTTRHKQNPPIFEIASGKSLSAIAHSLRTQGLIRSEPLFVLYVQAIGAERGLKAGTYRISYGLNALQVASIIFKGLSESNDIQVFIPEGFNIWEVDKRFAATGLIKEGDLAKGYAKEEGHLFPDTYRFAPGTPIEQIVHIMESAYYTKAGIPSQTTLIIASMLEKEARTPEDMALVSGVIANRLKKGMALQLDATVGYGWCVKRFAVTGKDCDVTQAPIATELRIDGPYNTYASEGLPKAPIANPGLQSLNAAAHPTSSDYLYYLSTRDGSKIIYAKTGAEHMRNRAKYLGL
jgi:UPF0755 protein